jgi:hypothetical protein
MGMGQALSPATSTSECTVGYGRVSREAAKNCHQLRLCSSVLYIYLYRFTFTFGRDWKMIIPIQTKNPLTSPFLVFLATGGGGGLSPLSAQHAAGGSKRALQHHNVHMVLQMLGIEDHLALPDLGS